MREVDIELFVRVRNCNPVILYAIKEDAIVRTWYVDSHRDGIYSTSILKTCAKVSRYSLQLTRPAVRYRACRESA